MDGITIRALGPADLALLERQPAGLFDGRIRPGDARAFLDSRDCILFAALAGDLVVGFASGAVLRHPDKAPSLFIHEVATRDGHLRQGLARGVTRALMDWARKRDMSRIWLATEPENAPARALYRALGGNERGVVAVGWGGALDE